MGHASRKITKVNEIHAALLLLLIVLVFAGVWYLSGALVSHESQDWKQKDENALSSVRKVYPMGKFVSFDSGNEDSFVLPSGFECNPISSSWQGELKIRIDSASIVDLEEAKSYVDEFTSPYWVDDYRSDQYLVCKVSLYNVSAQPLSEDEDGKKLFDKSMLSIRGTNEDAAFVTGVPRDSDGTGAYFKLPVKKEVHATFVFRISKKRLASDEGIELQVGEMGLNADRYLLN